MLSALVELTLREGEKVWVGTDHVLAIEPLAEDPDKLSVVKLAIATTYFDATARRWVQGPTGYVVYGRADEIAKRMLIAQQVAQETVYKAPS